MKRQYVGEFENSASAYGTFDHGGNVREWNEAQDTSWADRAYRGVRGGMSSYYSLALRASNRYQENPTVESNMMGFRVAAVPEPSSLIALGALVAPLVTLRRRRA